MKPGYLSTLTYNAALKFTHWIYVDMAESRLTMEGVNFFDGAQASKWSHSMRHGDMITLVAKGGWTIAGISVDGEHVYLHPMSRSK